MNESKNNSDFSRQNKSEADIHILQEVNNIYVAPHK